MKKKIFLITLMVALFVCLFVISASASEMFTSEYTNEITKFYDEDGTTELKPDFANLTDTEATAVLKLADESYVRVPLYYIYQVNGTTFYDDIRDTSNTGSAGFKYAWISEQLGETINHANLFALDIPEGTIKVNSINKCTSLKEVVFPLTATGFPKSENHASVEKVFARQEIAEDGTIKGITSVSDYAFKNAKALAYFAMELDYLTYIGVNSFLNTAITEVYIEGPITAIGNAPYSGCKSLVSVYINNTSDTIVSSSQLFNGATNISSVTLNGISLGSYTLQNANALTNANGTFIATNVGSISNEAFKTADNFTTFDISGPITSIGNSIFVSTSSIVNVKIINTGTTLATCGSNIFAEKNNLKNVEIHNISIGSRMFYKVTSAETLKISGALTSIGQEAFYECSSLTEFTIPDTVTSIGNYAFYKSGIKSITIPGSVSSIGNRVFQYCPNLSEAYFLASNENVTLTVGDNLFGTDKNSDINTALKKVVFDKDCKITTIGVYMFFYCQSLEFLSMPDSVTSIASSAFLGCKALGALYLSPNITSIHSTDIFENCNNMYFAESFFTDPSEAVKPDVYYFPNCITTLSTELFKYCNNLNSTIVFGESLTSVTNGYAFARNSATTTLNVVFLGNVTTLKTDKEAYKTNFYFCAKGATMEAITFNNTQKGECYAYVCSQGVYRALKDSATTAMTDANHLIKLGNQSQDATCLENQMTFDLCFCGAKLNKEEVENTALGHNYDIMNATAIVYTDYTKDGVYTTVCLRCEHDVEETVKGSNLFEYLGVSASTKGTGLCAGYLLNKDYIDAYAKLNASFEYGVVATVIKGTNKAPLADDYDGKVMQAPLNSYTEIKAVDVVVSGNYTNIAPESLESYNSYSLAMSLYVKDEGGISYIWNAEGDTAGTHAEVSTTTIYMEKATA